MDRSSLPPRVYAAQINAQSSVNNVAVQVLVSAGGVDSGGNLGVIYSLLCDPLLDETVAQRAVGSNGLAYPFQFIDVPAGEHETVAGTAAVRQGERYKTSYPREEKLLTHLKSAMLGKTL